MPFFVMNPDQQPCFSPEKQPRLLYVSLWTFANNEKPRTMHRHNDICEVLLTVEGHGVHTIDGEVCHTSRGDLLVYNAGVVHEDDSPAGGMERIYCCGVGGLRLPGLPENCLLPRGAAARLRTGARFGDFEALYRLIYEQATDPRRHSDEIAARLLPVLLLMVTQLGWEAGDPDQPESAQANQMRGYIDTHYNEELTLEKNCGSGRDQPVLCVAPVQRVLRLFPDAVRHAAPDRRGAVAAAFLGGKHCGNRAKDRI